MLRSPLPDNKRIPDRFMWRHKHFKSTVLFGFPEISENVSIYYVFSPKLRCYS